MPKFRVTLTETVKFFVDVEADSEEKANELALNTWLQSEDPDAQFCTQGEGVTVYFTAPLSDKS